VSSSTTNHPEPEEQLQWLIERARDHEHAALKRTIVYCLIAVVVAGLVLGIIGWQIQADPNLTWAWLELLIIPTVLGAGASGLTPRSEDLNKSLPVGKGRMTECCPKTEREKMLYSDTSTECRS
jgi:hypothetical protein